MNKSDYIDEQLDKLTYYKRRRLNLMALNLFENTTLEQREKIDKMEIFANLTNAHWVIFEFLYKFNARVRGSKKTNQK